MADATVVAALRSELQATAAACGQSIQYWERLGGLLNYPRVA